MIAGRILSSGRVSCTTAAVSGSSIPAGGLYFDTDGKLHVAVSGTIAGHVSGLPVTSTGRLAVSAGTVSDIGVGGLRICTDGTLSIANNGTPALGVGGLPVNTAGALVTTGAA